MIFAINLTWLFRAIQILIGGIVFIGIMVQVVVAKEIRQGTDGHYDLISIAPNYYDNSVFVTPKSGSSSPLLVIPYFWIIDYRAAERAVGVQTPRNWEALMSMDGPSFRAWSSAMSRFKNDPLQIDTLSAQTLLARSAPALAPKLAVKTQGLPTVMGVNWFDVSKVLTMGEGMRYDFGEFDTPRLTVIEHRIIGGLNIELGSALSKHGFLKRTLAGVDAWYRFEDGEVRNDMMSPSDALNSRWGDPFGVNFGSASRIAHLGNTIFGSPFSGETETMIANSQEGRPSLAGHPDFRAALDAVTNKSIGGGITIQTAFISPIAGHPKIITDRILGTFAHDRAKTQFLENLLDDQSKTGKLPFYRLIAMADKQDGDEEVSVLALVYENEASASAGAKIFADRFRAFVPPLSKIRWFADREVSVSHQVFNAETHDRAVALVILRSSPSQNSKTGLQRGQLFQDLFRHVLTGAADILIAGN